MIIICAILSAIILVYLWLLFPALKKRELGQLCRLPIAHRGIHDDESTAENSLGAFAKAVNAGLPMELDVRLTKDMVPVVMHDRNVQRVCGVSANVDELTASELAELTFIEGGEHVPTLAEVLSLVDGKVSLLIELKGSDRSPVAEKTAALLDTYKGHYAIESFNPYYLYRYRRINKNAPLGFLSGKRSLKDGLSGWVTSRLLVNFLFRGDFIAYGYTEKLPFSIRLAKKLGSRLMVWTIRDRERYEDSKKRFDGIIAEKISEIT
ncbi:MAG: glycerophosphodiester phosphodiesterase [Clostridia bacterium]|nr:glycerophosphodiester phosphodiesterase [Clostridia bacterium]